MTILTNIKLLLLLELNHKEMIMNTIKLIFYMAVIIVTADSSAVLHKPGWRNPLKGWMRDGASLKEAVNSMDTYEKYRSIVKSKRFHEVANELNVSSRIKSVIKSDVPITTDFCQMIENENLVDKFMDDYTKLVKFCWHLNYFTSNFGRRLSQFFRKSHFEQ